MVQGQHCFNIGPKTASPVRCMFTDLIKRSFSGHLITGTLLFGWYFFDNGHVLPRIAKLSQFVSVAVCKVNSVFGDIPIKQFRDPVDSFFVKRGILRAWIWTTGASKARLAVNCYSFHSQNNHSPQPGHSFMLK